MNDDNHFGDHPYDLVYELVQKMSTDELNAHEDENLQEYKDKQVKSRITRSPHGMNWRVGWQQMLRSQTN